jgi:hypothetical protein
MKQIICWWSGGVTSAVACKIAIDLYGRENCRVIMIDTCNEHPDTYRFKDDCQKWYGIEIERITGIDIASIKDPERKELYLSRGPYTFIDVGHVYEKIQDVWFRALSLNVATGAICSTELKRRVREKWQDKNEFDHQIFGFEFDKKEFNRALSMTLNHQKAKPIYPLLMMGYDKDDCIKQIQAQGIEVPLMYHLGFHNNNCFGTGCVQGGIGYWQKMQKDFPDIFEEMAGVEHLLTFLKGEPVTMLKDQSNKAAKTVKDTGIKWKHLVFLKKHPDYPELKCIDDMKAQKVKPLFECNGFCGTNDFEPSETSKEINYK